MLKPFRRRQRQAASLRLRRHGTAVTMAASTSASVALGLFVGGLLHTQLGTRT
jgi:hypothetical protein